MRGLCKNKPDSQGVRACRAIPCDMLRTAECLFPALSHVLALVGKEGRILYVSDPWHSSFKELSSRMLLHFILRDWLPYKAKVPQCQSSGPAAGWSHSGSLGQRLPATHANLGKTPPKNASSGAGQTFHTLGLEEGKHRQGFFP